MSVYRSSSVVRKVGDELICAICLNYLTDPKLLACAHSFCRICLARCLSRDYLTRAEGFECPTCRQITQIPNFNVDLLQTNHQLRALVDIISSKKMDSQGSIKLTECDKHPTLKKEYYCMDCCELLCKRCMMEKHRLHNYDETEMVISSLYSSLEKNVQSAKESLQVAERATNELDSTKAGIRMEERLLKARIETFFDLTKKQLDRCQASLIENVTTVSESKVSSLNLKSQQIISAHSILLEVVAKLQKLANGEVAVTILTEGKENIEESKKQQEVISAITQSLSKEVKLSVVFKEESPESITEMFSSLCTISTDTTIDDDTDASVESPLISASDSKMFECEDHVYETPLRVQLSRISSLPTLPAVHQSCIPVKRSPTTTSLMVPPFKSPVSVIPLTQKDRFTSESIHPCGIAVGTNNQIIVTDVHSNSVKVLAQSGKVIDTIGSSRGSTLFRGPCAVALDEDNNIFIVERETRRIHKFSNGNLVELAKVSRKLVEPWGIAISGGKIFVTDWQGCCIHVFEHTGGSKCNHVASIGSDFLKQPAGIAINPRGNLVVADQENHCVWILTQEGRSLIHPIGNKGDQLGQLYQPFGVTVTSKGLLVVSDKGNSCISVFTEQGQLVECFGRKGSDPGEFDQPRHVCVNSIGQIFVADELNQRIQVFQLA